MPTSRLLETIGHRTANNSQQMGFITLAVGRDVRDTSARSFSAHLRRRAGVRHARRSPIDCPPLGHPLDTRSAHARPEGAPFAVRRAPAEAAPGTRIATLGAGQAADDRASDTRDDSSCVARLLGNRPATKDRPHLRRVPLFAVVTRAERQSPGRRVEPIVSRPKTIVEPPTSGFLETIKAPTRSKTNAPLLTANEPLGSGDERNALETDPNTCRPTRRRGKRRANVARRARKPVGDSADGRRRSRSAVFREAGRRERRAPSAADVARVLSGASNHR